MDINKLRQAGNQPAPAKTPAAPSTPAPFTPTSRAFPSVLTPEARRQVELSVRVDELEERVAALEALLKKTEG